MSEIFSSGKLPILALRGLAVFPEQTVHFDIGRVKSALALEDAMKRDQVLFLVPQKDILIDDPAYSDLYPIGTVVKVKQILKSHNDNIRVLVTGICRGKVVSTEETEPFLSGYIETVNEIAVADNLRTRAMRREAVSLYSSYIERLENSAQGVQLRLMASESCGYIADSIAPARIIVITIFLILYCSLLIKTFSSIFYSPFYNLK